MRCGKTFLALHQLHDAGAQEIAPTTTAFETKALPGAADARELSCVRALGADRQVTQTVKDAADSYLPHTR
jgi:hypothetical protein